MFKATLFTTVLAVLLATAAAAPAEAAAAADPPRCGVNNLVCPGPQYTCCGPITSTGGTCLILSPGQVCAF